MKSLKPAWSSPYKTKLWLFGMNSDTFCKKELELWEYIAGFGARGCRDTNTQLQLEIHRSKRMTQYYLRNLESHHLIETIPGWAELAGSRFVKPLRYRRIIALPWPSKQVWMRESIRRSVNFGVQKIAPYQRRLTKSKINSRRDALFFTSPGPHPEKESPARPAMSFSPQTPAGYSVQKTEGERQHFELVRRGCIEQLLKAGWTREKAIALGNVKAYRILNTTKGKKP